MIKTELDDKMDLAYRALEELERKTSTVDLQPHYKKIYDALAAVEARLQPKAAQQKVIGLEWGICGFGLIVPFASGVIYRNHTDGIVCRQLGLQGLYIPLQGEDGHNPQEQLWDYFGMRGEDRPMPLADFIDALIRRCTRFKGISVDRSRLNEIVEAWVPVTIDAKEHAWSCMVEGIEVNQAILTWPNSD